MKPKFKVGDEVVIKNQKGVLECFNSQKGIIQKTFLSDFNGRRWYHIKLINGTVFEASARELDFAEVSPKNTPKFKIGDWVIIKNQKGRKGTVIETFISTGIRIYTIKDEDGILRYCRVCELELLELQPRTITLTLDQAKEYYKADGELRKIALQVFTEDELNPKPKYPMSFKESKYYGRISFVPVKLQDKIFALSKLLYLREEWIHIWSQDQGLEKDWEPIWKYENVYCIVTNDKNINEVLSMHNSQRSLNFPTQQLACDFLDTFKDLLEQAKGLY